MSPTLTLFRKETRTALLRPATWGVFAASVALLSILYILALRNNAAHAQEIPPIFTACLTLMVPLPVTFFTMSLFARERATGSLETLLTAPVSDAEVVLGKFEAALFLVMLSLCVTLPVLFVHVRLAVPPPALPFIPMLGGYLGMFLLAAALTAFGTLASLAVRHEAAAASATFVFSMMLSTAVAEDFLGIGIGSIADTLGVCAFASGVSDSRPIVTFVSLTMYFLFVAVRLLESRHWASFESSR